MNNNKNSSFQIKLPIIIFSTLAAGILIGATMANPSSNKDTVLEGITRIKEILLQVDQNYVEEVDTDKLVNSAISGIIKELDPHTSYIPAKDLEMVSADLKGNFEGIGIEFNIFNDTLYVVAPLSGGPSETAGLQSGDKIIAVDGKNIAGVGLTNRQVHENLRGEKGSEVKLQIMRSGLEEPVEYKIVRDKIPQFSVDVSYMVDDEIGYIKVSRFSATTYNEFMEALNKLKEQGLQKLILDLQDNPGGYMDKAINMADEFLKDNAMIVYTKGKEKRYNSEARAIKDGEFEDSPLIVLINEGSASASEIVSGAIQDNDRGLIVGRRSFGKGLVQMPVPLKDGSELRLTISRYYTPSGRSIQKPFGEDPNEYRNEMNYRYEHGEYFVADSIEFDDSLKYTTSNGRIVYGGGGIMPDYFVPLDTAQTSTYLNRLFLSNSLRQYTFSYYEKNKKMLENMGMEGFINNFQVTDKMLNELTNLAKTNDVKFNEDGFNKSKDLIKLYSKAYIARNIWNNEGFYPIFNQQNEVFLEALKLFDRAESLAKK
ncbi:peptidase S41 [Marivirga tractuosa]|uniref:C-terminal processing peptidase-3 n=1 Tax=Marivirga tractuosa (strain ATCC 23168 / DSM 4126 / NBRC 15989 / NCIMB 1408 / VKM B-1430 / H-43) TaxID=643867 RepID=E4TUP5_MARTH|nr:S41 family peptidase [Marivirga tractuosa]ADR20023.1 C-terminal processing peptidase-3 [Marivirga tractuosa DSM 4126]BDD15545.1 peptidase S41 [Marivirga tractuosa]